MLHLFLLMKVTDKVVKQMKIIYYFCECFKPAYSLNLLQLEVGVNVRCHLEICRNPLTHSPPTSVIEQAFLVEPAGRDCSHY